MKVLIIGGTGNISTAITRILVERGDEVTLYNRGKTQARIPGDCKSIVGDRYDYAAFEAQMIEADTFDCVIDMIGLKPQDVESTIRSFAGRIGQYVFCSTVDVYTRPAERYPITEDAERRPSPDFPYALNKAVCENILLEAYERGDFVLTIIRPAKTYNDSQCPIALIGTGTHFLRRVRQGKPIIILGDGTSFYVAAHRDDVGPAFVGAVGNPNAFGKAYHVTGEERITWEQMYGTVAEVMDAPPLDLVHIPTDLLGRMAPKSAERCVVNWRYNKIFDNAAAKADLDFRYTIPWADGVRRMVAWHDARGAIDNAPDHPLYDRIVSVWRDLGENAVQALAGWDK